MPGNTAAGCAMRIRIKFSKNGLMKYVSHLDVMRYFQKVLRRCDVDVAFSAGFSPHMLMSFALPLGVGMTSDGEYFDLDVNSAPPADELLRRMNETQAEGFAVLSIRKVPEDKSSKCMTAVAASDYEVSFAEELPEDTEEKLKAFLALDTIEVVKKTKRHEETVNIRPWIYEMKLLPDGKLYMLLSAGSVHHLRPELAAEAFKNHIMDNLPPVSGIHRKELYASRDGRLLPLAELGENF